MEDLDLVNLGFVKCDDVNDYVRPITDKVRFRCHIRRLRAHVWLEQDVKGTAGEVQELVYMNSFSRIGLTKLVMVLCLLKN